MGISRIINEKNTRSADFCSDQIDVITNFGVITNVAIKRVHCGYRLYVEIIHEVRGLSPVQANKPWFYAFIPPSSV